MMQQIFTKALTAGNERIVAWADVLDQINVYPVPDGDTGRNLVISLSPLRDMTGDPESVTRETMMLARGNSGNIAACFFAGFLGCKDLQSLPASAEAGRNLAYGAVPDPKPGTILTLFDTLVESLRRNPPDRDRNWVLPLIEDLENAVISTTEQLPELKAAGVVDAGALGMFVFFDSFFSTLAGSEAKYSSPASSLRESFILAETWQDEGRQGYCLDVVLQIGQEEQNTMKRILDLGESVIAIPEGDYCKVHLHAVDKERAREELISIGTVVRWAEDDLSEQTRRFIQPRKDQAIHIMTDAAGSMSRDMAANLGVTLLDSYIHMGKSCLPESYLEPAELFVAMREGVRVSTSQASVAERHECYEKAMGLHNRVLYLCVGSFYTGNYGVVMDWKAGNDPEGRMIVINTGLASGRLGLAARAVAELSLSVTDPEEVIAFAKKAIENVQELIFLDKLQFLAAGGRISKTGAFFGDVLHLKPIVSPYPEGVKKLGVARNAKDQVKFAFERLTDALSGDEEATLMLEHSDNREWLEAEIQPEIKRRFPRARVIIQPLSLTSASHMGPGTWGVAFLPAKSQ